MGEVLIMDNMNIYKGNTINTTIMARKNKVMRLMFTLNLLLLRLFCRLNEGEIRFNSTFNVLIINDIFFIIEYKIGKMARGHPVRDASLGKKIPSSKTHPVRDASPIGGISTYRVPTVRRSTRENCFYQYQIPTGLMEYSSLPNTTALRPTSDITNPHPITTSFSPYFLKQNNLSSKECPQSLNLITSLNFPCIMARKNKVMRDSWVYEILK